MSASTAASIFSALVGPWKISRRISSLLPSAPSGSLSGVAIFTAREPTAPGFKDEYLYSERGVFEMDGGLQMNAKRGYVYRLRDDDSQDDTTDIDSSISCHRENLEGATQTQPGISAWFVTPPDSRSSDVGTEVDKFFYAFNFEDSESLCEKFDSFSVDRARSLNDVGGMRQLPSDIDSILNSKKIIARGSHLCSEDFYESEHEFIVEGGDGGITVQSLKEMRIKYVVKGPKKDYIAETWYSRNE